MADVDLPIAWLTPEEKLAWRESNYQARYTLFASIVSFTSSGIAGFRLLRSRSTWAASKDIARAQHGIAQLIHAVLSVSSAVYLLSNHNTSSICGDRLFCFDQLMSRMLDVHAGYLIGEWIFFHNNSTLIRPRFNLLGLHHVLLLLGYITYRMHPLSLTLRLLPWYQALSVAQGAEAWLELNIAFSAPLHARLKALMTLVLTCMGRAIGSFALSLYTMYFIASKDVFKVQLMEAGRDRRALNKLYCITYVGGGFLLTAICISWFRMATRTMTRTHDTLAASENKDRTKASATQEMSGSAKRKKRTK